MLHVCRQYLPRGLKLPSLGGLERQGIGVAALDLEPWVLWAVGFGSRAGLGCFGLHRVAGLGLPALVGDKSPRIRL